MGLYPAKVPPSRRLVRDAVTLRAVGPAAHATRKRTTELTRARPSSRSQWTARSCPAQYGFRSSRLSTLPTGESGSASTTSIDLGTL
jgi:hypothetical protein